MIDVKELRRLAEAVPEISEDGLSIEDMIRYEEFYNAANPATVIELLDAWEHQKDFLKDLAEHTSEVEAKLISIRVERAKLIEVLKFTRDILSEAEDTGYNTSTVRTSLLWDTDQALKECSSIQIKGEQ